MSVLMELLFSKFTSKLNHKLKILTKNGMCHGVLLFAHNYKHVLRYCLLKQVVRKVDTRCCIAYEDSFLKRILNIFYLQLKYVPHIFFSNFVNIIQIYTYFEDIAVWYSRTQN